ncbi:MAG: bifunctional 5,10-methylenetetrahydrofolate dehydrogenase/5,10-methenyltetrahydrofolate cyclohydrolase [Candidatus Omnitrophica bacterium]|nr:bifunctional 5,10-methylenetetrahydrofolate dehydrogenase/5,10-methenyltetrahydrofolate cyclohydrolase [Candidatus Omnitrophota bacterium]
MSAKVLDGKAIASKIKKELKKEIESLIKKYQKVPVLVSIQVSRDAGIESYVKAQKKAADCLGIGYRRQLLAEDIDAGGLIEKIEELNNRDEVTAIILQQPLSEKVMEEERQGNISKTAFEQFIDAAKDAEGTHLKNLGSLFYGSKLETASFGKLAPCTAMAVMELLDSLNGDPREEDLRGKEVVIVGHSKIIGKPLSLLLLNRFATTTVCHIATSERNHLKEHVERAEVLISAVGQPGLIKGGWIKEGAVVIDVGTSRINGKLAGDVEFDKAKERASCITPVPGGVGPLTTIMLMKNVVTLYRKAND